MNKVLIKIFRILFNERGTMGLTGDQASLYLKDMYKAERESMMEIEAMYPKILKTITNATGAGDKATQLLKAGPLTRHLSEGQDIQFNSVIEGWTAYVKYWTFSDGLSFGPEAIEDTVKLGNLLKDLASTWGEEDRATKEAFVARAFNNGGALSGDYIFNGTHTGNTDSSGDLLYDSKPLFNLTGNTRTTKGGATYYNAVAGLAISEDDFETLYNLMTATNNRDEQDRIKANPVDTVLVRPGSDLFKAKRVLNTERGMSGGNFNDLNPYYGIIKNIFAWDYLTDTSFYVGKAQHSAIEFHDRARPDIRFFRHEPNAGYKASIRVRFGMFFKPGAWKAWGKGGGTFA
jgi:hypothetical protein